MYTSEVAASYIHTHIKIHTNTCTHTELFSVSVHCRDTGQITLAWHIADHRSRPKRRATSSPAFSLCSAGVLTYGWIIKQQVIVEGVVVTPTQETRSYELAQSGLVVCSWGRFQVCPDELGHLGSRALLRSLIYDH